MPPESCPLRVKVRSLERAKAKAASVILRMAAAPTATGVAEAKTVAKVEVASDAVKSKKLVQTPAIGLPETALPVVVTEIEIVVVTEMVVIAP